MPSNVMHSTHAPIDVFGERYQAPTHVPCTRLERGLRACCLAQARELSSRDQRHLLPIGQTWAANLAVPSHTANSNTALVIAAELQETDQACHLLYLKA